MTDLNANDFAEDIIGVSEYAPEKPVKKVFLPWHRPRKQFVRQKQWTGEIQKMVSELMPENNVLKYLGLPGDDLLDLRYFHHNICQPNNIFLKFLGFNYSANPQSSHSSELNISLDEIRKLPFVDPTSDLIGDNFCRIANTNSMAFNSSERMGPYDVVNIDLCDGLGMINENQPNETYYDAINQLMTLQTRRKSPWLLLLTTRTGSKHVNKNKFELLKKLYLNNLNDCPNFLTESFEKLVIIDQESLEEALQTSKGVSDVFLVALCKWMSTLAIAQRPPSKLSVRSIIGYTIEADTGHQDLVSIAIKINPTNMAQRDDLGLATQQDQVLDECVTAIQALNKVSKIVDVDLKLKEDMQLMDSMITASISLLKEARYDTAEYENWAKEV